jgi:hypothetical protein
MPRPGKTRGRPNKLTLSAVADLLMRLCHIDDVIGPFKHLRFFGKMQNRYLGKRATIVRSFAMSVSSILINDGYGECSLWWWMVEGERSVVGLGCRSDVRMERGCDVRDLTALGVCVRCVRGAIAVPGTIGHNSRCGRGSPPSTNLARELGAMYFGIPVY